MTTQTNTAESGSNGATVATSDAGNPAWDAVNIGASCTLTYSNSGGCIRGTLCYSAVVGVTTASCYVEWNVNGGASAATQYHRMYIDPADTAGAPIMARGLDSTGATQRWRLAYSAGTVILRDAANGAVFTSSALSSGTRYRVEWQVAGSVTGACRLLVYVGESTSPTYDSGAGSGNFGGVIQRVRGGVASGQASVSLKFDDFGWSDTAALGPAVKDSGTLAGGLPLGGVYAGVDVPVGPVTPPVPTTWVPRFLIEAALGADPTGDPAGWTWTDITRYVRGAIQITRGRPSLGSGQPAQCSFRLNNTDSRFTPWHPLSPWYGQWLRGVPVRVSLDPGTGTYGVRFQGYLASGAEVWPSGNSDQAEFPVVAAGKLRQMDQGKLPRSPTDRAIAAAGAPVLLRWDLDDASTATVAASKLVGGRPLAPTAGTVTFGVASTLYSAPTVATLASGAAMTSVVPAYNSTGAYTVSYWMRPFTATNSATQVTLLDLFTPGGTVASARVTAYLSAARVALTLYDGTGALIGTVDTSALGINPLDGSWHNICVQIENFGSAVRYDLWLDGREAGPATIAATTNGTPTTFTLRNSTVAGDTGTIDVALVVAWTDQVSPIYQAGLGYSGESATARVTRICGEAGIPVTVTGTSTTLMGPQPTATDVDLLRECEAVDQGILSDGLSAGLIYLAGAARYNGAVAMALDVNRRHVKLPVDPVEDDSRTRNVVTASGSAGPPATYVGSDPLNPLSTGRVGYYTDQVQVNVASAADLAQQAAWRVHVGTVAEMRVATLPIMPSDTLEIMPSWLACDLGSRYTVAHMPSQYPGDLDQVVEYYTETFDKVAWQVALTGSPASTWRVLQLDLDRADLDGQYLAVDVSTTATSWSVVSPTLPLITTDPAEYPYYIQCEGEVVRATACTGSSSPQTLTVVRAINGRVASHAATAKVLLWPSTPAAL